MNLFTVGPGRMVALEESGFPMRITLPGWSGFSSMQAIITSLGVNEQCNVQFTHTLRNFIYIYSFGDRIADMVIGGVAMTTAPCGQNAATETGFEKVFRYYRSMRLTARGTPITITIGVRLRFNAFLIAGGLGFEDPQTGLSKFAFQLRYPAQDNNVIAAAAPLPNNAVLQNLVNTVSPFGQAVIQNLVNTGPPFGQLVSAAVMLN